MRLFHLVRYDDETGLSGTGVVAEGVEFTDGMVVLRWTTATPTTEILRSLDETLYLHGHEGKTVARFVNGEERAYSTPEQPRSRVPAGGEHAVYERVWPNA